MSELHPPVEILSEGWKRIEFPRRVYENDADSFTPIIPSDTLLDELIRIPQSLWYDPLEFQQYRNLFLPQEYDYSNQKLLRDYSNSLIDEINNNRFDSENQSATMKFLESFCDRNGIKYEHFEYSLLLVKYCKNIMPLKKTNRADRGAMLGVLSSKYAQCKNASDFVKVNSYAYLRGEIIVGYSFEQSLKDFTDILYDDEKEELIKTILKEYKEPDNTFEKIKNNSREKSRCENILSNRFSELGVAFREVKSFISQVVRAGEAEEYNQAVYADGTNSRKESRRSGATPCLQQCAYCYRFWMNPGKISITCKSAVCKRYDGNRKRKIKRRYAQ